MPSDPPNGASFMPVDALRSFAEAALARAGLPDAEAGRAAGLMLESDLAGADGHGLFRLPQYVRRLRAGGINPRPAIRVAAETAATAVVDGDNGLGHLVMDRATGLAVEKARDAGAAWIGVRGSNHAGAASVWAATMLPHDMIGLYLAVGSANHMAPWGGTELLLSTNPIAVAVPAGAEAPIVVDMATTVAAYGKVKLAAQRGETMPEGWMIDREGQPLTDPTRAAEGLLVPSGGYKGYALALDGSTYPLSGNLHYSTQEPYGVVGRIVPFNHPLFFAAGKVAAPLVAGNAVVLKAPDQTPLSALRMAELAADVFGPDLCGVVSGRGATTGAALVAHPLIRRIGFIGAEPTGRLIQRQAAEHGVKHVSLELGGKNALVVMPDADLAKAADAAVFGMNFTATAGQSCGSTSRLLLHESVADEVLASVVEQVRAIRVGHPLEPGTQMGPVVDRAQYEKSMRTITAATAAGAPVLVGGGRPDTVGEEGWYVAPTVLGPMAADNPAAVEEVFGPVLSVLTFRDEDEAVAIANRTEYGLTAGVFTSDVTRAHRMAAALQAGYVWVNGSSRHYWGLPFGGVKASGVGREESVDELLSYTETKAVTVVLE